MNVQWIQATHIVRPNFEIKNVNILRDEFQCFRLGNGYMTALQLVTNEHLSWRLIVLVSYGFKRWIVQQFRLSGELNRTFRWTYWFVLFYMLLQRILLKVCDIVSPNGPKAMTKMLFFAQNEDNSFCVMNGWHSNSITDGGWSQSFNKRMSCSSLKLDTPMFLTNPDACNSSYQDS